MNYLNILIFFALSVSIFFSLFAEEIISNERIKAKIYNNGLKRNKSQRSAYKAQKNKWNKHGHSRRHKNGNVFPTLPDFTNGSVNSDSTSENQSEIREIEDNWHNVLPEAVITNIIVDNNFSNIFGQDGNGNPIHILATGKPSQVNSGDTSDAIYDMTGNDTKVLLHLSPVTESSPSTTTGPTKSMEVNLEEKIEVEENGRKIDKNEVGVEN